jgi:hypothetical protein
MADREAAGAPPPAASPDPAAAEAAALFALVSARYGSRLDARQLDGVRKAIEGIVEQARAVRAVRLGNADEPYQTFRPYRADEAPRP